MRPRGVVIRHLIGGHHGAGDVPQGLTTRAGACRRGERAGVGPWLARGRAGLDARRPRARSCAPKRVPGGSASRHGDNTGCAGTKPAPWTCDRVEPLLHAMRSDRAALLAVRIPATSRGGVRQRNLASCRTGGMCGTTARGVRWQRRCLPPASPARQRASYIAPARSRQRWIRRGASGRGGRLPEPRWPGAKQRSACRDRVYPGREAGRMPIGWRNAQAFG